jgi:hypothetical protein
MLDVGLTVPATIPPDVGNRLMASALGEAFTAVPEVLFCCVKLEALDSAAVIVASVKVAGVAIYFSIVSRTCSPETVG